MALVAYSDESDVEMEEEETCDGMSESLLVTTTATVTSSSLGSVNYTTANVEKKIELHKNEEIDGNISDDEYEGQTGVPNGDSLGKSIFAVLPVPTKDSTDLLEEEVVIPNLTEKELKEREAVEAEKKALKEKKSTGRRRIVIPSLSEFSDLENLQIKEKPMVFGKSGSGLLSMLPEPKKSSGKELNRALIPNSLLRPKATIDVKKVAVVQAKMRQPSKPALPISDDEDDGGSEFFSFAEKEPLDVPAIPLEEIISIKPDRKRHLETHEETHVSYTGNSIEFEATAESYESTSYAGVSVPITASHPTMDDEAMVRLLGKRARFHEQINFVEVSEDSIRADPKDLLKQISLEKQSAPSGGFSASKKDGPDAVSRRKHQITHLVHQAKSREIELKNQWAANRQTKRQTQSKYGF